MQKHLGEEQVVQTGVSTSVEINWYCKVFGNASFPHCWNATLYFSFIRMLRVSGSAWCSGHHTAPGGGDVEEPEMTWTPSVFQLYISKPQSTGCRSVFIRSCLYGTFKATMIITTCLHKDDTCSVTAGGRLMNSFTQRLHCTLPYNILRYIYSIYTYILYTYRMYWSMRGMSGSKFTWM